MYWSWDVAYQQLQTAVALLENPNPRGISEFLATDPLEQGNYRKVSGDAASAGTLAHQLVEQWIHARKGERLSMARKTGAELAGTYRYPVEIAEKARNSFLGFVEWAHQWKLTVLHTELRLVSEEFNFGGTIDCIAELGPKDRRQMVLLDWKTSKSIYADYLCQVAAYGILWNEHFPDDMLYGYHLVRFDKDEGDYHHHQWGDLVEAAQMFLHLRQCYDLLATVEKRAK
jgi:hypothetical protein